jgi:hypothetical protein
MLEVAVEEGIDGHVKLAERLKVPVTAIREAARRITYHAQRVLALAAPEETP